jgi:hypothetical protein
MMQMICRNSGTSNMITERFPAPMLGAPFDRRDGKRSISEGIQIVATIAERDMVGEKHEWQPPAQFRDENQAQCVLPGGLLATWAVPVSNIPRRMLLVQKMRQSWQARSE